MDGAASEVIMKGMFKKETDLTLFTGMTVTVQPKQGDAVQVCGQPPILSHAKLLRVPHTTFLSLKHAASRTQRS